MSKYDPAAVFNERLAVLELAAEELGLKPERLRELMAQVRREKEENVHGCWQGAECTRPVEARLPKCFLLERCDLLAQLTIAAVWYYDNGERKDLPKAIATAKRMAAGRTDEIDSYGAFLLWDALGSMPARTPAMQDCYLKLGELKSEGDPDAKPSAKKPHERNGKVEPDDAESL